MNKIFKRGTLIYIDQNVKYKIREELKLYKSKEIESTFLEKSKTIKKNVIDGCIYKHPGAAIQEFTNDFICPLLEKLITEKKEVILMGDYNINILNSDVDNQTNFLNTMYSNSFFPTINTPNHISTTSRTLIDNMFYNDITKNIISGNITTYISDHLTQYLIVTNKHRDGCPFTDKKTMLFL